MHVLVAAMPFAGHVRPMASLAAELVGRGHAVTAYTGAAYGGRFEAVGATWLPWRNAPDFDERDLAATFPQVSDGRGPRAVLANLEHVFLRTGAGQAADIESAGPFDVLVSEHLALGPGLVAERTGVPWASVSLVPLGLPSRDLPPMGLALLPGAGRPGRLRDAALRRAVGLTLGRRLDRIHAEVRESVGLPPSVVPAMSAFYSPQLVIAHGVPELEYPRTDLPEHVHFVGQLAPPPGERPVPPWAGALTGDGAPVVHVTQGTYDVDPSDLILPALQGLGTAAVRVAVATGGAELPADRLPANAHQAPFLPYDWLLPRTSVVVTNGGWGGVLAALAAGVPLVVAGGTLDKPEIARRVSWSGAGVDLRTGRPTPEQVADGVARVLGDDRYRRRARTISDSLARHGGATAAAELVERLASGRAPVRRAVPDPWVAAG